MKFKIAFCLSLIYIFAFQSCSTTKFVPDGEYLLESVKISSDNKKISPLELEPFIKQKANYRMFELVQFPLYMYSLSGKDSTKWINKVLRSGGEPPVIYDSTMVDRTANELKRILSNKGYVYAKVEPEIRVGNKKVNVRYNITTGDPYLIADYLININDSVFEDGVNSINNAFPRNRTNRDTTAFSIDRLILRNTLVKKNATLDLNVLDEERNRISSIFRRTGYYNFNKEYIGFVADTTVTKDRVSLELVVYPFMEKLNSGKIKERPHHQYIVKDVLFYPEYNPLTDGSLDDFQPSSIVTQGQYSILYGPREQYIRPSVIFTSCYIRPGMPYDENLTALTYNTLSQLQILKNVSIRYEEIEVNDSIQLRCIITCIPEKKQSVSTEIEGTNSAGFFGVGIGMGYLHRNAFKGSELFNIRVTAAYEAITPNFSQFSDNYFEIGGETSLRFPRFMFPFLSYNQKRRLHASTQFTSNYTYQRRPGYFSRTVLATGVKYLWQNRRNSAVRHSFDLIDLSYAHIPHIDSTFNSTLTDNARIYSFTDQFIMAMGYSYSNNNYNSSNKRSHTLYSIHASIETAGNTLALIAALAKIQPGENGSREIFNTFFAQYVRGSVDYSKTIRVDDKNSIAWRIGGGLAYPYGNNKLVPFEKRFFSGGANSVRGWAVRELGPGSYYSPKANFYSQSGDIRLDANVEYRTMAFWKFEFAAFLDAGNIWTIRDYEGQEGGGIRLNSFYKQIALGWGLGIRLDLDFVLLRLDAGWKLYNPADIPNYRSDGSGGFIQDGYRSKWAVMRPLNFKENVSWHIAVGYPF